MAKQKHHAPHARGNAVAVTQQLVDKARLIQHQIDADALQIVLRDYGLGEGKVADICTRYHEAAEEICDGIASGNPDRDYHIEVLDRGLRSRMPGHFLPFEARYGGLLKQPMPIGGPK
jgi:hypothetical protein